MQLTKSYFDKHFSSLLKNLATKKDLKQLELRTDDKIDKLARIVASGFEAQQQYMDARFKELRDELDVRSQMNTIQKRLERLEAQHSYRRQ